jgi:hypothetical protein
VRKTCSVQALQQFMESDEVLSDSFLWSKEQPHRVSMFTGFVKSVRKMAGAEPRIPTPSQVESGSGQMEHDLVRQIAEIRVNRKALHENADTVRATPGIAVSLEEHFQVCQSSWRPPATLAHYYSDRQLLWSFSDAREDPKRNVLLLCT